MIFIFLALTSFSFNLSSQAWGVVLPTQSEMQTQFYSSSFTSVLPNHLDRDLFFKLFYKTAGKQVSHIDFCRIAFQTAINHSHLITESLEVLNQSKHFVDEFTDLIQVQVNSDLQTLCVLFENLARCLLPGDEAEAVLKLWEKREITWGLRYDDQDQAIHFSYELVLDRNTAMNALQITRGIRITQRGEFTPQPGEP